MWEFITTIIPVVNDKLVMINKEAEKYIRAKAW